MSATVSKIKIREIAEPVALNCNLLIWDIEFKKEANEWYLRVFIHKDNGITLEDCETFSNALSDILDEEDPIAVPYYLEVSSPGIDRLLKEDWHYEMFIGSPVIIKMYKPVNGVKKLEGLLKDYKDGTVYLELENKNLIEIPSENNAWVRLNPDI